MECGDGLGERETRSGRRGQGGVDQLSQVDFPLIFQPSISLRRDISAFSIAIRNLLLYERANLLSGQRAVWNLKMRLRAINIATLFAAARSNRPSDWCGMRVAYQGSRTSATKPEHQGRLPD